MKANETRFQPIIEGTKQYIVPLFQRAYSWDKKEWGVLWDDLVDLCNDNGSRSHFIGSIVTMPVRSVPEGVTKYLLIDGQQRLATIFILLALLRDLAKNDGNEELANEINQTMLVNQFKKEDDHFKLLPTQVDRDSFKKLIHQEPSNNQSRMSECYLFFDRKLRRESITIQNLKEVITNRLSVVSIVLDGDDNPHLVFESLNAKGRSLTQADLIRNYFFMKIHPNEQEKIHNQYWKPMQDGLEDSLENLTECIRHYLTRNGGTVKKSEVYFTLKEQIEQKDVIEALKEISAFATYYQKLIEPEKETNIDIRNALKRINRLEVTTVYPFFLNCYNDYYTERISADDFTGIIQAIENYIIRRFVCNIPTNTLNKIFPPLYGQAIGENPANLVDGVRKALQIRGYPSDVEFQARLKDSRLYGSGERAERVKLILETLEDAYQHKEKLSFDTLSIEHIMPQTLTEWWKNHLDEYWAADHDIYLHTLGNLTLTGYNAELSNDTFPKKQQRFIESNLELNHYFKDVERWTKVEIEKRSEALSKLALSIWTYFGDNQFTEINIDDVTGKKPKILTILGQQIAVNTWRDVLKQTLNTIADIEPEGFNILVKEYPSYIGLDSSIFRESQQLNNGYFVELNFSAKAVYNLCTQAIELIDLSPEDWKVETESKKVNEYETNKDIL